jgi:hypothetical protein
MELAYKAERWQLLTDTVDKLRTGMGGRNNRIRDHPRANQYCMRRRLDESLLRASTSKLVYQQHRHQAEAPKCADLRPVLAVKPTSAPRR